jgi:ParB-like chromosome segregation protein Spo0J
LVTVIVDWDTNGNLVVVDGRRRVAAIRYGNESGLFVGKDGEPAILPVRCELFKGGQKETFATAAVTNVKRKGLTPIDRAHSMATMEKAGKSRKDIAKLMDVSESTITQDLKLLTLSAALQKDIHSGRLAASIGYELAGLEPAERAKALETTSASTPASSTTTARVPADAGGQTGGEAKPTRTSVRRAKRDKAEKGEATRGPVSRSRKEVYNLFAEWAGCGDGSIEDPIMKLCAAICKYMNGETGDRAVLNRMRELVEGGE